MRQEERVEFRDRRIGVTTKLLDAQSRRLRDEENWPCDAEGKRYSRSYKRPTIKRHYRGLQPHELRHTHFTLRLADGMDLPTAQALGGWKSPQVLLNVYAHPVAENVWASANFMDRLNDESQC